MREWSVTSSDQIAHLLPAGWNDPATAPEIVKAACGARFKRRSAVMAARKHPHATLKCYACTRAEQRLASANETSITTGGSGDDPDRTPF